MDPNAPGTAGRAPVSLDTNRHRTGVVDGISVNVKVADPRKFTRTVAGESFAVEAAKPTLANAAKQMPVKKDSLMTCTRFSPVSRIGLVPDNN